MKDLVYEKLTKEFEESLLTQLRGHNNEAGFLEMWVPDPDVEKSIINMIEAAEIYGLVEFNLTVGEATIDESKIKSLNASISDLAAISFEKKGESFMLKIGRIGSMK